MSLELTPIWHSFWIKSRKYVWKKPWRVRPSNQGLGWLDGADFCPTPILNETFPSPYSPLLACTQVNLTRPLMVNREKLLPWNLYVSLSAWELYMVESHYSLRPSNHELSLLDEATFLPTQRYDETFPPVVTFLPTLSNDETFPSPWSHYLACIQVGPSTLETACRWNLYCGPLLSVCVDVHMHKCARSQSEICVLRLWKLAKQELSLWPLLQDELMRTWHVFFYSNVSLLFIQRWHKVQLRVQVTSC